MPSKAAKQPRPEIIPFLDVVAEMLADAVMQDLENQNATGDVAPRQHGNVEQQQERANIVTSISQVPAV